MASYLSFIKSSFLILISNESEEIFLSRLKRGSSGIRRLWDSACALSWASEKCGNLSNFHTEVKYPSKLDCGVWSISHMYVRNRNSSRSVLIVLHAVLCGTSPIVYDFSYRGALLIIENYFSSIDIRFSRCQTNKWIDWSGSSKHGWRTALFVPLRWNPTHVRSIQPITQGHAWNGTISRHILLIPIRNLVIIRSLIPFHRKKVLW